MYAQSTPEGSRIVEDFRWQAVVARDPAYDGRFYYAVTTTGIYCRPSCAARRANPQHVRFYPTCVEAEKAGFRPCKRCRPNQPDGSEPNAAKVAEVCRILEAAEVAPSLGELARSNGFSRFHFHRVFKVLTGLTPKAYAAACRARRLRDLLANGDTTVTAALYDAGFGSSGRFYESADQMLGMTPTQYLAGGACTEIRFALGECSLGAILVARSARGVCAIFLGNDPDELVRDLQDQFPRAELVGGDRNFEALVAEVIDFVEAPQIGLTLPLDIRGTAFQQRVWKALAEIPPGTTATYTDIAARIGAPKAARAVAKACAANRVAVAIPCHRVVRTDGGLSGYRWGVERKRALLDKERSK